MDLARITARTGKIKGMAGHLPWMPLLLVGLWAGLLEVGATGQDRSGRGTEVRLDVYYQSGGSITGPQDWLRVLRRAGISQVRLSAANGTVRPEVHQRASGTTVIGVLGTDNRLQLPRASFSLREVGRVAGHLRHLTARKESAGQHAQQAAPIAAPLAAPIPDDTRGTAYRKLIAQQIEAMDIPIRIDRQARPALLDDTPIQTELKGLSRGTALAYLLDLKGLVLRSESAGGGMAIEPATEDAESWPIGRLPKGSLREQAPQLLEFLPVRIRETPLTTVLEALRKRLELPMLIAYGELEPQEIDLDAIVVTLPEERTFYKKVLDRSLFQGRMKAHLRLDDGGRPFLWIRPIQPR